MGWGDVGSVGGISHGGESFILPPLIDKSFRKVAWNDDNTTTSARLNT
jgi:hypothetical protein